MLHMPTYELSTDTKNALRLAELEAILGMRVR
jgi:hypothetical protein